MKNNKKNELPSFSRINPLKIDSIGFQFTNKCILKCKHCGASSGPKGVDGPEIEWMLNLTNKLFDNNFKTIMITGGEPFLRYNDLLNFIRRANEYGMIIEVVSNGFWGNDSNKVKKYVKELSLVGLNKLTLSVDKFHQRYISKDAIKTICYFIKEKNCPIDLRIYTLEDDFGENNFLIGLEKELNCTLQIFAQPILPVGRAKKNLTEIEIKRDYLSDTENHPCHLVLFPYIDSYKNWFMCSNGATLGFNSRFCLGKLYDPLNFNKFMSVHLSSNIFRFMKNIGPIELFKAININPYNKRYVSVCELCLKTFKHRITANRINKFVDSDETVELLDAIDKELLNEQANFFS